MINDLRLLVSLVITFPPAQLAGNDRRFIKFSYNIDTLLLIQFHNDNRPATVACRQRRWTAMVADV